MSAPDQPQAPPGPEGEATSASVLAALEWRVSAVEARQAELRSFREDVTRELQATGSKVMFLNEQGVATRKQLDMVQSKMTALGIELDQGMPQLSAQVQANAQDPVDLRPLNLRVNL